ncbi:hypothetical protein CBM2592_B110036 [Cupriavidus taiwanensis]|nr:hypothetical protein CBM2588_B140030 [Cupriavidus taiwanensis]SOY63499.1 hypothetical protein CBM2592_B110036 [Cupriavidus taiwanensis]SOY93702.1 hypothetical protein CBM2591_B100009 [Cupriavidus taiwanensis]SOZ85364.1 hypothetical protein CBM2618_B130122 [Cupriavidus taiwanensis]SOZ88755.1 hypothetical protein CBM2622_B140124 [Cupriavidus taiwanensis]
MLRAVADFFAFFGEGTHLPWFHLCTLLDKLRINGIESRMPRRPSSMIDPAISWLRRLKRA